MLGHGHDELRPRLLEERRPLARVIPLGLEERDEILVAEARLRSVGRDVVFELVGPGRVHVPRVPLVAEGGHGVDAPMNEDAELPVQVPRGHLEAFQRFP